MTERPKPTGVPHSEVRGLPHGDPGVGSALRGGGGLRASFLRARLLPGLGGERRREGEGPGRGKAHRVTRESADGIAIDPVRGMTVAPRAAAPDRETLMHGHQHGSHNSNDHRGFSISGRWVLIGFIAIAGYFLLTEHRAHAIQLLPFLLLLAYPLLHMFHGHGGHGRHRHGDERLEGDAPKRERTEGDSQ